MTLERWLVVGLGNPGPTYTRTRHNIGFDVVDRLAGRHGGSFARSRSGRSFVTTARLVVIGSPSDTPASLAVTFPAVLVKPMTFMNDSGPPVQELRQFYKSEPDHLVVVHDELDIPFGTVRLKRGGGDNGHNGLRSITSSLGSNDYHRVRVGIGRPPGRQDPAAFVLRDFSAVERPDVALLVDLAADAVELLLGQGLALAQSAINGRSPQA